MARIRLMMTFGTKERVAAYNKAYKLKYPEKFLESTKAWRKSDKGRLSALKYKLKTYYGTTIEAVEEMKLAQGGVCAICSLEPVKWCVDHNHSTGQVRGMLCHNCNVAIGHLKDDPILIAKTLVYIKTNGGLSGNNKNVPIPGHDSDKEDIQARQED